MLNNPATFSPAYRPDPRRQKIPLCDQFPDLCMELAYLPLMITRPPLGTVGTHVGETRDRLPLPGPNLVRMNLMLRRNLLKRPVPAKRLCSPEILLRCPPVCIPPSDGGLHLGFPSDFPGHFSPGSQRPWKISIDDAIEREEHN